jgi:hypothetical protein
MLNGLPVVRASLRLAAIASSPTGRQAAVSARVLFINATGTERGCSGGDQHQRHGTQGTRRPAGRRADQISAMWTAMLFVFAYVDIFGSTGPTS